MSIISRRELMSAAAAGAALVVGRGLGRRARAAKPTPRPFRLHVDDAAIGDLRERLARTRWPDEPPLEPWATGAGLAYMKGLCEYWRTKFDWRAQEARLNAFQQFTVPIRGCDVHFLHVKGKGEHPMPLLVAHGWPGSVFEFLRFIPMLGDFSIVAPSLPGFGLSFRPGQQRCSVQEMSDIFAELMTILGYERFGAQGGDWGAAIASYLGYAYPKRVVGIQLNFPWIRREPPAGATPSPEENAYLGEREKLRAEEFGYAEIQGTKPETLAYGLSDSPVGLAAWIVEKFRRWTDNDGDPASAVPRDEMLANVSLYWFSGAIGSSFWPYYAANHSAWRLVPDDKKVDVPMGYVDFPKDIVHPPREVLARGYSDIRRWTVEKHGGHFASMERPDVLAREVRALFSPLR